MIFKHLHIQNMFLDICFKANKIHLKPDGSFLGQYTYTILNIVWALHSIS